jgi:hypothetical protein
MTYFDTPDSQLLLSSDGILVARAPGLDVRKPTRQELTETAAAAFGRAMDGVNYVAFQTPPALLSSEHDMYEKTRKVFEKIPELGEFSEFAFAIADLMGWTQTRDPLLEQVKAMDSLLHAYFTMVDQQVFAGWSSTRLAMLADVQALASSARETIRSIVANEEDLQSPLTIARLALADRDSLTAVNTFTSAVESGYWLRPYSGPAVGLNEWGSKVDDRAPVYGDGTVWDPRLVLPSLLYALTVRMVVLKALYSSRRKYCHEVRQRVDFLLKVQMHWQTGIRRKLHLSAPEVKIGAGFSVRPFAAGAVDVFTGTYDLIDVDYDALNLAQALGFYRGPLKPGVAPIPAELVAPTITFTDIDLRFETEYRAILEKQSAVAFTRLRWATGLQAFSDTIKSLGEVCARDQRDEMVAVYRDSLPLVRESGGGLKPAGARDDAQDRVELARALGQVIHEGAERAGARAMADRYALYCALKDKDGRLMSELREIVSRQVNDERPWAVEHQRPAAGHKPDVGGQTSS